MSLLLYFDTRMRRKDPNILIEQREKTRQFLDKLPFCEEGKRNLLGLMEVLQEIEEAHKNELLESRRYATVRGGKLLEGPPTDIGFTNGEKVPAIFDVRIITDTSGKRSNFLAYSTTAHCVASGSTWKKALVAMRNEIIRVLELKNEQVPRPIVMEVDKCYAGGDHFFYDAIKERQALYEPLYLKFKETREYFEMLDSEVKDPGRTRLVGYEE